MSEIKDILSRFKTVAVVGCSRNPEKPAHFVPKYLKQNGYKIIPVNPSAEEVLGEKCYPSLLDVPDEIDIVDILRSSDQAEPIVDAAIKKKAKVIWMQEGIVNERAAEKARAAGLEVVMNRCMMKEHKILFGGDKMRLNNLDMAKAGAFLYTLRRFFIKHNWSYSEIIIKSGHSELLGGSHRSNLRCFYHRAISHSGACSSHMRSVKTD